MRSDRDAVPTFNISSMCNRVCHSDSWGVSNSHAKLHPSSHNCASTEFRSAILESVWFLCLCVLFFTILQKSINNSTRKLTMRRTSVECVIGMIQFPRRFANKQPSSAATQNRNWNKKTCEDRRWKISAGLIILLS